MVIDWMDKEGYIHSIPTMDAKRKTELSLEALYDRIEQLEAKNNELKKRVKALEERN